MYLLIVYCTWFYSDACWVSSIHGETIFRSVSTALCQMPVYCYQALCLDRCYHPPSSLRCSYWRSFKTFSNIAYWIFTLFVNYRSEITTSSIDKMINFIVMICIATTIMLPWIVFIIDINNRHSRWWWWWLIVICFWGVPCEYFRWSLEN